MSENKKKQSLKSRFSPKRIAMRIAFIGMFVALAYALSFFSFPIFPATPYFKLDFSNIFILFGSLYLGPVEGIIICILKEILGITNSSSGGVGELANAIMTSSFILIPSIVHHKKPATKPLLLSFIPACVVGIACALVTNRFIIFPMYMGGGAKAIFYDAIWFAVAFNLIKTASISILTFVIYKRTNTLLKKFKIE